MFRFEKRILDFLRNHLDLVVIIVVTIVAILIRVFMIKYQSGDYNIYLSQWFDYIKDNGLRATFASGGIGDYNCPYVILLWVLTKIPLPSLVSIKIVSIIFDFGVAVMAALIVKKVLNKKKRNKFLSILTYSVVILLPTVMVNSSMWAQCDSIYVFFVLCSIYLLMIKKYRYSFMLLGAASAFKLQFIFVLPIYLLVYLRRQEFSILNFLWIPVALIVLSVPALVCGLPLFDLFKIYFVQIGEYKALTLNMFNIYKIFEGEYQYVSLIGYAVCFLFFGGMYYFILKNNVEIDNRKLLKMLLLSVLVCVYFLPSMHERYGYLADILSVIYFTIGGSIAVPITVELTSLIGYFAYLFKTDVAGFEFLALAPLVLIMYLSRDVMKMNDNNNLKR